MAGLLARTRPYLVAEVYRYLPEERRVKLVRTLAGLGYRVRRVRSEAELAGEDVTEANVMAWKHYDVFCSPA